MRLLILCLCLTFSAITGTYAQQTNVELPDYTKWVMQLDHSEGYTYKGKDVQLRDQHYGLETATTRSVVLVYFTPEDSDKTWFAIYMTVDASDNLSGTLFERKEEVWSFMQNLSRDDLNDTATVFKSRYDLEYKKK